MLEELGVTNPSTELLTELVAASIRKMGVTALWHPSEIVANLQNHYEIYGYSTSYNGKQQYHIICEDGDKNTALRKVNIEIKNKTFTQGSKEAIKWVDELLNIYAQKLVGAGLGAINPILGVIPWEILFTSKPSPNTISSNGNQTIMTLNTVCIQKFVFIYDSLSDEWEFALSTNKVIFAFTLVETVLYNGIPYNNHDTWNNQVIAGNYYSATSDAVMPVIYRESSRKVSV